LLFIRKIAKLLKCSSGDKTIQVWVVLFF
jgi:hypothetical protein